jgi:hypothetical protein
VCAVLQISARSIDCRPRRRNHKRKFSCLCQSASSIRLKALRTAVHKEQGPHPFFLDSRIPFFLMAVSCTPRGRCQQSATGSHKHGQVLTVSRQPPRPARYLLKSHSHHGEGKPAQFSPTGHWSNLMNRGLRATLVSGSDVPARNVSSYGYYRSPDPQIRDYSPRRTPHLIQLRSSIQILCNNESFICSEYNHETTFKRMLIVGWRLFCSSSKRPQLTASSGTAKTFQSGRKRREPCH